MTTPDWKLCEGRENRETLRQTNAFPTSCHIPDSVISPRKKSPWYPTSGTNACYTGSLPSFFWAPVYNLIKSLSKLILLLSMKFVLKIHEAKGLGICSGGCWFVCDPSSPSCAHLRWEGKPPLDSSTPTFLKQLWPRNVKHLIHMRGDWKGRDGEPHTE